MPARPKVIPLRSRQRSSPATERFVPRIATRRALGTHFPLPAATADGFIPGNALINGVRCAQRSNGGRRRSVGILAVDVRSSLPIDVLLLRTAPNQPALRVLEKRVDVVPDHLADLLSHRNAHDRGAAVRPFDRDRVVVDI